MRKEISRQRKWQQDMVILGLCTQCGKPVAKGKRLCKKHREMDRIRHIGKRLIFKEPSKEAIEWAIGKYRKGTGK